MSGFVFSVGPVEQFITSSYVEKTFTEYDASLAEALGETGPVLTNVIDDEINDAIYKFDDDKNEFVQPLEIEDGVDKADMYNYEAEYGLDGKVLNGRSLTRIVVRQLCDASLDEDGMVDVDPGSGTVHSVFIYGPSQGSVVNWLYDFSNVSEDV